MIIKECYINGYGNICNKHIIFNNINEYIKHNGYGKSSLVSFIIAMLYGLDTVKANNKEFLDRKHYYPFNSNLFGGSLTLEDEHDTYKIERIFDKKSANKDELKVYKNNNLVDILVPGEALFKLDKESFIRLFIIKSDDIKIKSTSNINEALSNISFSTTNIESTINELETKMKLYNTKGKNSLLVQANEKKNVLTNKINNLENIEANLNNKYKRLNELEKYVRDYNNKLSEIDIINSIKGYDDNLSSINKQILEAKSNFNDTPKLDELDNIIKLNNEKNTITTRLNNISLSESDTNYYNYLSNKYKDNKVTEDDINNILNVEKDIEVIKSNISSKNSAIVKLNNHNLSNLDNDYKEVTKLNNNIKKITDKPKFNPLLSILGIIIDIILPISLFFTTNNILFYILLITSILSIITTLYFIYKDYNKYKKDKNEYNINIENNNRIINSINNILSKYNVSDLTSFNVLYNNYLSDLNELETSKSDISRLEEELKNKNKLITDFYSKYSIFDNNIFKLRKELDDYNRFNNILSDNDELKIELNNRLKTINNNIINFYNNYNINSNLSISDIRDLIININTNVINYNNVKNSKEDYIKDNNITNINYDLINEKEDIINNKNNLEKEINTLRLLISDDNKKVEDLDDLKFELEDINSKIDYYKAQYNLYNNTIKELNKAYNDITDKYIKPVKDKINNYLVNLNNNIDINLDSNYNLSYTSDGAIRDINHLSSGEYTILAFAYVLALVDSINNNLDFIILDDPFINLDSTNINNVKTIINNISKYKQIIYLTCHESRSIE